MSDKTKDWVERQNNTTFTYLNQIKFREDLKQRFEKIWNYESCPLLFLKANMFIIIEITAFKINMFYIEKMALKRFF